MKRSTRACALCESIIPDNHIVCRKHFQEYTLYKEEDWFKVLIDSARRQFEIDNEEIAIELGDIAREVKSRRRLTESDKEQILNYKKKGLGYVSIGKILDLNPDTVKTYLARLKV